MLTLKGHKHPIQSVAFAPDGTALLTVDGGSGIRVWDLPSGKLRWEASEYYFSSAAFTPDSKFVITADRAGNRPVDLGARKRLPFEMQYPVRLHDSVTGVVAPGPFQYPTGEGLYELTFTPDGTRCVARPGFDTKDLVWWEYPSGSPLPPWKNVVGHDYWKFRAMAIAPDGRTLAGVNTEGLSIFDMPDGELRLRHAFKVVQGEARFAYHPDGRQIVFASGTRGAMFDLEKRSEIVEIKQAKKHFLALAFTMDGRHLATVSNEETVKFWDPSTGQLATEYAWEVGGLRCLAFAPDGTTAATGGTGKKIVVWDLDA
ncbi:MAG TPA: WD40 repeat domain-containing protein [Gemmataceae bacterium]|jgi:WD40 repeat protein|nr:WD40 repeat domain-containing protein [Gemmataceae bacterium]